MQSFLRGLSLSMLAVMVAACGSRPEPRLYRPGDLDVFPTVARSTTEAPANLPRVNVQTNLGSFTIELYPDKAPASVANFLRYVDEGFYGGTVFHRVISGFVVQGGGFTLDGTEKPTREPVPDESTNGLRNLRGTVALARTQDPNSASAQFFINVADNTDLNRQGQEAGYTVFGRVVDGMRVVDKISFVETSNVGGMANVPAEPVIIESIQRVRP